MSLMERCRGVEVAFLGEDELSFGVNIEVLEQDQNIRSVAERDQNVSEGQHCSDKRYADWPELSFRPPLSQRPAAIALPSYLYTKQKERQVYIFRFYKNALRVFLEALYTCLFFMIKTSCDHYRKVVKNRYLASQRSIFPNQYKHRFEIFEIYFFYLTDVYVT